MGDVYEEVAPPPSLAPFVEALWAYRADAPSGAVQRIVPDGCCELLLHLGAPYEEQRSDGRWVRQPEVLFAGQLTRALLLRPTGPVRVVSARFAPDGARALLGFPQSEATDRTVDMAGRMGGERPCTTADLATWLDARRLEAGWALDPVVRTALADERPPPGSPAASRALQRAFLDRVGISQQTLRSIRRFRSVFNHAEHPDAAAGAWLEAGLAVGYFDQPQLARDFRRFLGCTATEWAREQAELARAIASQSYKTDEGSAV